MTVDGRPVQVPEGSTVLDAARSLNIDIPVLCHTPGEEPVGVCRICTVEMVKDQRTERVLSAACARHAEAGLEVHTATERVLRARRTIYEMLLADHPTPCARQRVTGDCELETQATAAGVGPPRFTRRLSSRGEDVSSRIIRVDHTACILCDRCIRACTDIRDNLVIGRTGKGSSAAIAFDLDVPMGQSTCVGCGECMVSCPTGALTNRWNAAVALEKGQPLTADELLALPMFSGVSGTFLRFNEGAVVRRRFQPGEVICREGEQGSTAYYILRGEVELSIAAPMGHARSRDGSAGKGMRNFFRRLTSLAKDAAVASAPRPVYIPIDAPVELAYDSRVARLGAGALIGQTTCLNRYPRASTVRAVVETDVLEMLANVLYILRKNKTFKAEIDRPYRERALRTQLRSVPALATLPEDFVDRLCHDAELVSYEPGEVICGADDPADAFFLVRIGFVKVSKQFPGGEMVVAYHGRGEYFGEFGLLQGGPMGATHSALDHVEVVRIPAEDFTAMVESFPAVRAQLAAEVETQVRRDRVQRETVSTVSIDDFLTQGLLDAQSLLLLDLERCTRCDLCVRACADTHDGITRLVRDGLRFEKYLVATSCRSCRDPLCMIGCPVSAIRRHDSLDIRIEDWCIGCGLCARNCPYGNINLHSLLVEHPDEAHPGRMIAVVQKKATTCDLSHDLKEPACVYACPHGAAMRVDPRTFFADRLRAEP